MLPNVFQETNFLEKCKVTDTLIDANSGILVKKNSLPVIFATLGARQAATSSQNRMEFLHK